MQLPRWWLLNVGITVGKQRFERFIEDKIRLRDQKALDKAKTSLLVDPAIKAALDSSNFYSSKQHPFIIMRLMGIIASL